MATSDKVFQDGVRGGGRQGGMLIFFTVAGVSSEADRNTALHSLGLLKASLPPRDGSEKYMCGYTRKCLWTSSQGGIGKWAIYMNEGTLTRL